MEARLSLWPAPAGWRGNAPGHEPRGPIARVSSGLASPRRQWAKRRTNDLRVLLMMPQPRGQHSVGWQHHGGEPNGGDGQAQDGSAESSRGDHGTCNK